MSSAFDISALPSWPYVFAWIVPFMPIAFFVGAQTRYARDMCGQVGFAQPLPPPTSKRDDRIPQDHELNSLLYLVANKEAVLGSVLLALQAAGDWKGAGIMLMCTCVGGAADVYVAVVKGSFGPWQAFQRIGLVKCIGVWAAWKICKENW